MADFDELRRIAHVAGSVFKEHLLLFFAHQAEELSGLSVVPEFIKLVS